MFANNSIKVPEYRYGYIFGNRVLNTYYELTVRYDGEDGLFCLGIADACYKNHKSLNLSLNNRIFYNGHGYYNG